MHYTISGKINAFGSPICSCKIVNSKTKKFIDINGILDTGAFNCHIKTHIAELVELPIIGSGKFIHPIDKEIEKCFYLGDLVLGEIWHYPELRFDTLHAENYPADFIIGVEFLKNYTFKYDGPEGIWLIEWDV